MVALKAFAYAKSRLDLPVALRQRLAEAMALDTLQALTAAIPVVLVVSDQPGLDALLRRAGIEANVLAERPRSGMNEALTAGDRRLRAEGFETVLACVGDLPALRPESVRMIIETAGRTGTERCFVSDVSGVGTTMLLAHRTALSPRFQGRSAAAHRASGAVNLSASLRLEVPDAHRDVDSQIDLHAASSLGLGTRTAILIDPATQQLGRLEVITTTDWRTSAGVPVVITSTGHRIELVTGRIADQLGRLRPGQRLHAVLDADGAVLSAWLA